VYAITFLVWLIALAYLVYGTVAASFNAFRSFRLPWKQGAIHAAIAVAGALSVQATYGEINPEWAFDSRASNEAQA
jgi:hypothetical protein